MRSRIDERLGGFQFFHGDRALHAEPPDLVRRNDCKCAPHPSVFADVVRISANIKAFAANDA